MVFSQALVAELIFKYYGKTVTVSKLDGYDELNYLAVASNDEKHIVKIGNKSHDFPFVEAQFQLMNHLSETSISPLLQNHLRDHKGNGIVRFQMDGSLFYLRMLTYIEGVFLNNCSSYPSELFESIGAFLGKMDKELSTFQHPALQRTYTWDISNVLAVWKDISYIHDHEKRRIAAYFLVQYESEVVPFTHQLRKATIHNDANETNVLIDEATLKISGIIDFGDSVYSHLINNLAIACTYSMMLSDAPLETAISIVSGYHSEYPLLNQEIDLLYYLIAARLCISVTQSAYQASINSTNTHHFISEKAAWKLLYQLIEINPIKASNAFRIACGFESSIPNLAVQDKLLARRKQSVGRNLSVGYTEPLTINKGALQYLYDNQGNTFIDCVNNVSHVGHCHPVVVKRMQRQLTQLNTNTRYLHESLVAYAEALLVTLPKNLSVCYFVNSGSEANDLAIRISRHFTQQKDIIVLDHAYHGTSTTAIEMSPYKFDAPGGFGQKPYIHKAINPDGYRGEHKLSDPTCGEKYALDVERIIQEQSANNIGIAAFICETLLGVGGQIPLPTHYLKHVYEHVRSAGGICIADEVQVGFGRVGKTFWGFELQGVEPDMVVLGKPIGNGHPMAAVIMTEELADAFDNGLEYFNTYGGNPVSMETGLAVLDVIQQEELQQHALEVGEILLDGFKQLQTKFPLIGDVRGTGLFVGVELVKDRTTLEPAIQEIKIVVEKMKERGFLISTDGPLNNVLKIKPPMVFSKANAIKMLTEIELVFQELSFT